jgi:hypothetical protein
MVPQSRACIRDFHRCRMVRDPPAARDVEVTTSEL